MYRKHECCSQILGIIAAALMLCGYVPGACGADKKSAVVSQFDRKIEEKNLALDSIKTRLDVGRQKVHALSSKEGTYLEQLELLEKNIEASRVYLVEISTQIDTLTLNITLLKDTLEIIEKTLAKRQRTMENRLRTIYKKGKPAIIEIIFTSSSVTDMLNRIYYFQKLNHYDRLLLRVIDSTKTVVNTQKRSLEEKQKDLVSLKASKEEEKLAFEKEKRDRKILLDQVKAEKKSYMAMVKELETAQEELNVLIKVLIEKRKKAKIELQKAVKTAFEKLKGKLPWPADGPVAREYGKIIHPVYKTVTMNNGIDIAASFGNKVICVAQGRVEYVGWMRGYGKFVIINHYGAYSTIYTHLDKIMVMPDQTLNTGDEIGQVGESGSLTGAKLHFQIRSSSDSLDPRDWLEKKEK